MTKLPATIYRAVPFYLAWAFSGALLLCATALDAAADDASHNFADFSIEQLMNEPVTSVSGKETKLSDSPAAISVISEDDVRRLDLTSIPEALRLVPGMDVARIDGNEWAVSSRGFNGQYANKLLVLVDGRSVYTPSTGGVFWNSEDIVFEDLSRIEVIRGPGATIWGANAVNGVVNVTTKSAKETQGGLFAVATGTGEIGVVTMRYGGQFTPNLYYRIYGKYSDDNGFVDAAGEGTADQSKSTRTGFRLDWIPKETDTLTLEGEYFTEDAGLTVSKNSLTSPLLSSANVIANNYGENLLGHWVHSYSDASSISVQAYADYAKQDNGWGTEYSKSYDLAFQQHSRIGGSNDVVWGTGYRVQEIRPTGSFDLTWSLANVRLATENVFLQDDITLPLTGWHLILGSKIEKQNLTDTQVEPSAQILWSIPGHQTLWGSVSRASRTPAVFDRFGRLNALTLPASSSTPPALVSEFGNPDADAEDLTAYELGYRIEPSKKITLDATAYFNSYQRLLIFVPGSPTLETNPLPAHILIPSVDENILSGTTYGVELSVQWQPAKNWRLVASSTSLRMHIWPDRSIEADSPMQQYQLRSFVDLPAHFELTSAAYYVSRISPLAGTTRVAVPSYVRADLGLTWHPIPSLEFGLWGQNLLDARHAEFRSVQSPVLTEVPRDIRAKTTWRF